MRLCAIRPSLRTGRSRLVALVARASRGPLGAGEAALGMVVVGQQRHHRRLDPIWASVRVPLAARACHKVL